MYVMPIKTLLEQRTFLPHQKLLAEGKVVEATRSMVVIYVSHEWCARRPPE
jgi:hypothetical protein